MLQRRWDQLRLVLTRTNPLSTASNNGSLWARRGQMFALLKCWDRAATDYGVAARLAPTSDGIICHQALTLAAAGDFEELKGAHSRLLDRLRHSTDSYRAADEVAWTCVLIPGAAPAYEALFRHAESALARYQHFQRSRGLRTLGGALYRAGRLEDAIRRLDEANRRAWPADLVRAPEEEKPQIWAFLAMAHHRLGNGNEARRLLGLLRGRRSSTDPAHVWNELEIDLLRSEAEAADPLRPVIPSRRVRSLSARFNPADSGAPTFHPKAASETELRQAVLIEDFLQFFCTHCPCQPNATTMRSTSRAIVDPGKIPGFHVNPVSAQCQADGRRAGLKIRSP